MSPTVVFQFTGAGTQSVPVDQDCFFTGGSTTGTTQTAMVSTDQSMATLFSLPTTQQIRTETTYYIAGTTQNRPPVRIPISADSTLFVTSSAQGSVILYFELPEISAE